MKHERLSDGCSQEASVVHNTPSENSIHFCLTLLKARVTHHNHNGTFIGDRIRADSLNWVHLLLKVVALADAYVIYIATRSIDVLLIARPFHYSPFVVHCIWYRKRWHVHY